MLDAGEGSAIASNSLQYNHTTSYSPCCLYTQTWRHSPFRSPGTLVLLDSFRPDNCNIEDELRHRERNGTTVPVVNVEPNENMEFACPPSIPPFGGQRTSCVGRRRVGGLQIPSRAPFGEPRATAPTRRPASLGVLLSI